MLNAVIKLFPFQEAMGFPNTLLMLCAENTQTFRCPLSLSSPFVFWGLLVAPVAFRKPYLNTLREATVAQKPRAHFDPCRSEAFFLSWGWASHGSLALPDVWRPGFFLCLILPTPLVNAYILGLWWTWRVSGHQQRKLKISPGNSNPLCIWPKELWHDPEPLCVWWTLSPF